VPTVIEQGRWVEIHRVVLAPRERAPQVPADTREVPLELRARGFLAHPAAQGEEVEVVTASGRRLRGVLAAVEPAYTHGFGPPIPELLEIGEQARALLDTAGEDR